MFWGSAVPRFPTVPRFRIRDRRVHRDVDSGSERGTSERRNRTTERRQPRNPEPRDLTKFYTGEMLLARRFLVSGRVQGVGFRFFVLEAAQLENVQGWVRNLPDGGVEAFVEGDREAVARVERKIRRGPPSARVENVQVFDDVPTGRFDGFSVR